eukprot:GFUD01021144.1.p1 GENE.GFUD01021144.1~~GFUD01021144.1.p1  ORF type:complete len:305 (-),score=65.03 GFUD01021144.1:317-1231(-)
MLSSDQNILVHTGTILLGLLCGEVVYRVYQLLEQWSDLGTRYRGSKTRLVQAVFTTRNYQHVSVAVLGILSVCLLATSENTGEVVKQALPWTIVWTLTRILEVFEFELDTQDILEESNALLGPGLAANYWFKLLKPLIEGRIRRKVTDFVRSLERTDIRSFNKLIILIPDNCDLRMTREDLEGQNIFNLGDISFAGLDQCVYWIHESAQDEESQKEDAQKILVLFDIPKILESAMGENRDYEDEDIIEFRMRNVNDFQDTIENLMNSVDYNGNRNDVIFHHFINTAEKNLAAVIRERIFMEEIQ